MKNYIYITLMGFALLTSTMNNCMEIQNEEFISKLIGYLSKDNVHEIRKLTEAGIIKKNPIIAREGENSFHTLLHLAISHDAHKTTEYLINLNTNLNTDNILDKSALTLAIESNDQATVNLLLKARVDAEAKDIISGLKQKDTEIALNILKSVPSDRFIYLLENSFQEIMEEASILHKFHLTERLYNIYKSTGRQLTEIETAYTKNKEKIAKIIKYHPDAFVNAAKLQDIKTVDLFIKQGAPIQSAINALEEQAKQPKSSYKSIQAAIEIIKNRAKHFKYKDFRNRVEAQFEDHKRRKIT